jgi:hypothetical protein
MALIPGSIPVTGFIAPTDTSDTYAVTDAIYGIDGLRNVPTYADMYNISLERRREGMIVGIMSDNTYWKLLPSTGSNIWNIGSASNWQEFAIFGGDDIISSYLTSSTIGFDINGATLSANILPNSITASLLSTTAGSATAGYVLTNDGIGNFTWISPSSVGGVISRFDKNYIMTYTTSGDGQFTGLTISATPINGCYVAVFVNGQEFDVGDGVTSSVSCYFSNDGGLTARNFASPNQVQIGDGLYWNGSFSGTDLYTSWRISLYYLT